MKNAIHIVVWGLNGFKKDDRARYLCSIIEKYPKGEAVRMESMLESLWGRMTRTDYAESLDEWHVNAVVESLLSLYYSDYPALIEVVNKFVSNIQVKDNNHERVRKFFQGILGGVLRMMTHAEDELVNEIDSVLEKMIAFLIVEILYRLILLGSINRDYSFENNLKWYLEFHGSNYGKEDKVSNLLALRHKLLIEEFAKRQFPKMAGSARIIFLMISTAIFSRVEPNKQISLLDEKVKEKPSKKK